MKRFVCLLVAWFAVAAAPGCDWLGSLISDCPPLTGNIVYSGDGGGGAGGDDGYGGAPDDGFGGSDVGVGDSSSDVGVGAGPGSSADVGAGAGPGSSADVGAGAGSARSAPVPHRMRRPPHHGHWKWIPREDIGVAVEAICTPNLSPFTTTRLRQVAAANGIGVGQTGITQSRTIGLAFETWVLTTLGVVPNPPGPGRNTTLFPSPQRAGANKTKGGLPASVIPEYVTVPVPLRLGTRVLRHPLSSLFEVKAVTGVITLGTSQWQILGLIDVTSQSPAGTPDLPSAPRPELVFTTTGNTAISPAVACEATPFGVAIWQQHGVRGPHHAGRPEPGSLHRRTHLAEPERLRRRPFPWRSGRPRRAQQVDAPTTQLTPIPGDPDPPEVD